MSDDVSAYLRPGEIEGVKLAYREGVFAGRTLVEALAMMAAFVQEHGRGLPIPSPWRAEYARELAARKRRCGTAPPAPCPLSGLAQPCFCEE